MDVRSIDQVQALPMHSGTVPVWWLVEPRAMKQETASGYLELIAEFEVAGAATRTATTRTSTTTC